MRDIYSLLLRKSGYFFIFWVILLGITTFLDLSDPYPDFYASRVQDKRAQILDRNGAPLSFSYQTHWNTSDIATLDDMPDMVQKAFIASEDHRFWEHSGVDWRARISAFWKFMRFSTHARGASTITEQVIRMIHPRPRSLWSKWLQGIEAVWLERNTNKADILEFYLNQVPYAAQRRGVIQAARYYFDRDLTTLNIKEILALAVLIRSPSKFDLYTGKVQLEETIFRLATLLHARGELEASVLANLQSYPLHVENNHLSVSASHFINYIRENEENRPFKAQKNKITTSLDSGLQQFVSELLENRLKYFSHRNVTHAAALVVDHKTHEILAYVSLGAKCRETQNLAKGCQIDMVRSPRQPGSALKPFLYAMALEKGWTPATLIEDRPFSQTVGKGLHHFRNYSGTYHGMITLRNALGNSLNIPAIHTIEFVTPQAYAAKLQSLGFESLQQQIDFYGEGLALGNGEVSLLELVQAYTTFPNHGDFEPIKGYLYANDLSQKKNIYGEAVSSLIGNILSDPWARASEFGNSSVLNIPIQTAVKTGTSTDYRDAWVVGYNYRYTIGIWMGNADYSPMDGITGSMGPSLVLRSIFNELNQHHETAPLYLSPHLIAKEICLDEKTSQLRSQDCMKRTEYFLSRDETKEVFSLKIPAKIEMLRPSQNLEMALDPRIPSEKQKFEMRLGGVLETDEVEWWIDNNIYTRQLGNKFLWPITRGKHHIAAIVWRNGTLGAILPTRDFQVK